VITFRDIIAVRPIPLFKTYPPNRSNRWSVLQINALLHFLGLPAAMGSLAADDEDVIHDRDRSQVKIHGDVLSRFSGRRSALRSSGKFLSKD
jgi:hypothetical protein